MVRDGSNAIKVLANALDILCGDTGWISLPALQNGWYQYPSWEVHGYRKKAGIVYLRGLLAPGTTTPGTLMFTMPVGFRNGSNSHTPVASGAATAGAINIYSTGVVNTNYNCTGWVSLNDVSYPADN
jgi:hypothetical protein